MFKNLIKKLKSTKGNSLAEFAVTTAMMATLAVTAAPKFGAIGDGAKEKMTMANIDKILTVANNFYNQAVSNEGKGRFPGQSKYDSEVGGIGLTEGESTDMALEMYVETILADKEGYTSSLTEFVYVYLVIPGSGSGSDAQAPVMVVIDTENPGNLYKTLVP